MSERDNAFRVELRALVPRLRRFGHAITGNSEDADDLVQDALERALARETQFSVGSRLDSWMYKIMQNAWIDRQRAAARQRRIIQPVDDAFLSVAAQAADNSEARVSLLQAQAMMMRLHEDERSVLALVGIEGLSYREAADMLSIPIGTVMSRLARARSRLTQLMDGRAAEKSEAGR